MRKKHSFWKLFLRNKGAVIGLIGVLGIFVMAIAATFFLEQPAGYGTAFLQAPSKEHWLGTDTLGLDIFGELAYGAKNSFYVSIVAVLVAAVIGIPLGLLSGFLKGAIGAVIDSVIEIFLTLPMLPLMIVLAAVSGASITNVAMVIGLFSWPSLARITRNSTMRISEMQYIEAARSLNISSINILFKHILRNIIGPISVNLILIMANAVLSESSLSFLGLGDPTTWSWGTVLKRAWENGAVLATPNPYWWWLFPSLLITLYVVSFHLLGNGFNDALDPKSTFDD